MSEDKHHDAADGAQAVGRVAAHGPPAPIASPAERATRSAKNMNCEIGFFRCLTVSTDAVADIGK